MVEVPVREIEMDIDTETGRVLVGQCGIPVRTEYITDNGELMVEVRYAVDDGRLVGVGVWAVRPWTVHPLGRLARLYAWLSRLGEKAARRTQTRPEDREGGERDG